MGYSVEVMILSTSWDLSLTRAESSGPTEGVGEPNSLSTAVILVEYTEDPMAGWIALDSTVTLHERTLRLALQLHAVKILIDGLDIMHNIIVSI